MSRKRHRAVLWAAAIASLALAPAAVEFYLRATRSVQSLFVDLQRGIRHGTCAGGRLPSRSRTLRPSSAGGLQTFAAFAQN